MPTKNKIFVFGLVGVLVLLIITFFVWFLFFHSTSSLTSAGQTSNFGSSGNTTSGVSTTGNTNQTTNQTQQIPVEVSTKKIFKIAEGPIAAAFYYEKKSPTTTIARFISATDGHVADLVLDSAGAVAKAVSNTTIPGIIKALWAEEGSSILLQYQDSGTTKTVYEAFATASTTSISQAGRLQFLPDNISDIAVSPDGKSVAYLIKTSGGSDGYIAKIDGTNSKKLFSLPLSQLLISWPSQSTLLTQTTSAVGIKGVVFSVDIKTGSISPLLYADGVTANANRSFSRILYQTVTGSDIFGSRSTYVHDIKKNTDVTLSFDPVPEKCVWSVLATSTAYCATPLSYVKTNYLDLWHKGIAVAYDAIYSYNAETGKSALVAIPGNTVDGGLQTGINEITLTGSEKYLLYISRNDDSLWAVRLTQ